MKRITFSILFSTALLNFAYTQEADTALGAETDTVFAEYDEINQEAEILYNSGISTFEQKNLSAALADFDKAIVIKPDCAKAYYNRGAVRYELKNYKGAINDYDKTIE